MEIDPIFHLIFLTCLALQIRFSGCNSCLLYGISQHKCWIFFSSAFPEDCSEEPQVSEARGRKVVPYLDEFGIC